MSRYLDCFGKAPRPFPTRAYVKHKESKGQSIKAPAPLNDLFPDESQFRFGVFITDGGALRVARMRLEAVAAAEHVKLDAADRQGAAE